MNGSIREVILNTNTKYIKWRSDIFTCVFVELVIQSDWPFNNCCWNVLLDVQHFRKTRRQSTNSIELVSSFETKMSPININWFWLDPTAILLSNSLRSQLYSMSSYSSIYIYLDVYILCRLPLNVVGERGKDPVRLQRTRYWRKSMKNENVDSVSPNRRMVTTFSWCWFCSSNDWSGIRKMNTCRG